LIASVALLLQSIGNTFAGASTSSVNLGSNSIVTIDCGRLNYAPDAHPTYPNSINPYIVPAGYDYIITDFGASSSSTSSALLINNTEIYVHHYGLHYGHTQHITLESGIKVPYGNSVLCTADTGFVSGYLVHP
jgi:hypothetical protein